MAVDGCFNSSIGILSVRTSPLLNSISTRLPVSIPRSEFFRFGLRSLIEQKLQLWKVSIPRSEFFRFGREVTATVTDGDGKFQFLDRNSFGSDSFSSSSAGGTSWSFNSSIGILSVRTAVDRMHGEEVRAVSIPRSEFFRFGLHG